MGQSYIPSATAFRGVMRPILLALLLANGSLQAMDLNSWLGETYSSMNGESKRAPAILKGGYEAQMISEMTGSSWHLEMETASSGLLAIDVPKKEIGSFPAPAAWEQAAGQPALGQEVGYFDVIGRWKLGKVSGFVLAIGSDEGSEWPTLLPVVDGLKDAPLILDEEIMQGKLGEPSVFTLPLSKTEDMVAMNRKVAEFLVARLGDPSFECDSGFGITGTACVKEVLGCPVQDLDGMQALLQDFRRLPLMLHWAWYGNADFGFMTGPAGDDPYWGYQVSFFLTKGDVTWMWGHRCYPEILSIGERKFLRVAGCKPSSDGCDAYVTEWGVDPCERHKERTKSPRT